MRRIAAAVIILALATACGSGNQVGGQRESGALPSAPDFAAASGGQGGDSQTQPGEFTAGSATISTPSGQANLEFSEGLYVRFNATVVANFNSLDLESGITGAGAAGGNAVGVPDGGLRAGVGFGSAHDSRNCPDRRS